MWSVRYEEVRENKVREKLVFVMLPTVNLASAKHRWSAHLESGIVQDQINPRIL